MTLGLSCNFEEICIEGWGHNVPLEGTSSRSSTKEQHDRM
jgi:hypothetical protein